MTEGVVFFDRGDGSALRPQPATEGSTGTVEVYTAAVVESGFVRECVPSFLHADSYFKKG